MVSGKLSEKTAGCQRSLFLRVVRVSLFQKLQLACCLDQISFQIEVFTHTVHSVVYIVFFDLSGTDAYAGY